MRIEDGVYLDFQDVLLKPKRSTINSRGDIGLVRNFKFLSGNIWAGVPIISSNMTKVTTPSVVGRMIKNEMLACIPKASWNDNYWNNPNIIRSIGLNDEVEPEEVGPFLCLDVPNGYIERVVDKVKELREGYGGILVAGNVVTSEQTEALILAGADVVKVGIGCLASGTRVLMSNMTYKNIEDINIGDRVINMNGKPTTVLSVKDSGYREVGKIDHVASIKSTFVTPDHQFYFGVFDSQSEQSLVSKGYRKSLLQQAKTIPKSDKIKWVPVSEPERAIALFPHDICWELPEDFTIDISEFFIRQDHNKNYKKVIKSSYGLGYIFGTFLGDGTSHLTYNKKTHSNSGSMSWVFGINEMSIARKLSSCLKEEFGKPGIISIRNNTIRVYFYAKPYAEWFSKFGKRNVKKLPEELLCDNKEYLQGIFDGLQDSDGSINGVESRDSFTNTSIELTELYALLHFRLLGYLPQFRIQPLSTGLENCNLENCNESYSVRSLSRPDYRLLSERGFGLIKILNRDFSNLIVTQTWDIEVEDDLHSFIADNVIVHNSGAACSTRVKTGVGVPQLSAVIECADAAHGLGGHIISDGGCVVAGDVVKAFCAGADFVMLGGMLAGHDENGSEFYGMSSKRGNEESAGGLKTYRASEGWEFELPKKGPIEDTLQDITGGLRSACSYLGARNIKSLPKCATFIRVNRQNNSSMFDYLNK
jgi:IMP dehydrogenase/GMP reductase